MRQYIKAFYNFTKNDNKVYSLLIGLIIFFLPLLSSISNIFIIALISFWFLRKPWKNQLIRKKLDLGFVLIILLFTIFFSSLFQRHGFLLELSQVEKRLSLFFIPLVLVTSFSYNKKYFNTIYIAIISTSSILAIFTLFQVLSIFLHGGTIPTVGKEVSNLTLIHRPYLVYFCLISSVISIYYIFLTEGSLKIKFLFSISYLVCAISIFVLVSRTAIAIFLIIHVYIFFKILLKSLTVKKISIITVFGLFTLLIAFLNYERFASRFDLLMEGKEEPRILIWNCSYDILKSTDYNFLFGFGSTVITQNYLTECYKNEYLNNSYWGWVYEHGYNFNTHNEYLNMLLSFGTPGFILFTFLLFYLFIKAWKAGNIVLQCYIIIFSLSCLTENFLARQYGIVSFSIMASLIIVERLGKTRT